MPIISNYHHAGPLWRLPPTNLAAITGLTRLQLLPGRIQELLLVHTLRCFTGVLFGSLDAVRFVGIVMLTIGTGPRHQIMLNNRLLGRVLLQEYSDVTYFVSSHLLDKSFPT